jgi:hypothetical protein
MTSRTSITHTGRRFLAAGLCLGLGAGTAAAQTAAAPPEQMAQYQAEAAKTILELQPFRREQTATLASGTALRLISLNPGINSWFLLVTGGGEGRGGASYHLENPDPRDRRIDLSAGPPAALMIAGTGGTGRCEPWTGNPSALESARGSGLPYAPLCGGALYLRNIVPGSRSNLERVTEFLRGHVWQGEEIVGLVRDNFYKDSFVESGRQATGGGDRPAADGPAPARTDPALAGTAVVPSDLGLVLAGTPSGRMTLGAWYAVAGLPGAFASAIQPKAISAEVRRGPGLTSALDKVEAGALDFMVAFDLARFDLGFALGTDHPGLGWSPRPPDAVRKGGLPGPDGVGSAAPLVTIGMVSPALTGRTAAAFAAGFKREHGAFRYGDLATRNRGSHYGFIEQGVIFSKLQPGLSTLYVLDDGSVGMKTWAAADDRLLPRIRFARQNGVALLETDPRTGEGVPRELVTRWGPGNWSGSAERMLRTLRAGACLLESGGRRFLVYGYFSTATPSAMARTFQAYGCRYAMLLDMNALEHTYLALYVPGQGEVHVEHLIPGMTEVDKTGRDGKLIPRFIGFPDNRDLFYLVRRGDPP